VPTDASTQANELELLGKATDEVDPELLALPDPPRGERRVTLLVLALTAAASVAMVVSLWKDAAYAFAAPREVDLGELRSAPAGAFAANSFVQARGMMGAAGAIRYERPFVEDSFRVTPVAGRPDVYVEVRVPAGEETARYVPPTELHGRLVRFDATGPRHRGLAAAIADRTGTPVPANAWLIVNGEAPEQARWAVALVMMFLGFALWNAAAIARLMRRVKA
jgi:hypothetical protein